MTFNGLGMNLGALSRLSDAETRSISAENPNGEKGKGAMAPADPKGAARELGQGWKCRPCIRVEPGNTAMLADICDSGAIQSIWLTGAMSRDLILRMYWDGQEQPSVEAPACDFFALPWQTYAQINSLPVAVNPRCGMNCFWVMPFRSRCRITIENVHPEKSAVVFYLLSDQLHSHRCLCRLCMFSCAVSQSQPDSLRKTLYDS